MIAVFVLAISGRIGEATGQFHWLIASAIVGATFYVIIFVAFLSKIPAKDSWELEKRIYELEEQTGYQNVPTFKVSFERVPEKDADRSLLDTELLYRVAIKNQSVRITLGAYAVLEDLPESLGISPAAKLTALGKEQDSGLYSIAPTETLYMRFIEKHSLRDGAPMLTFAADTSSDSSMTRAMTSLIRESSRTGELEPGREYDGAIVVCAKDAVTSRTRFSISIGTDGNPDVIVK